MDKQGFIDFNTRLSAENSGKADSYARAIQILDEVLPYQSVINLQGQSLYNIKDISVIEAVLDLVNDEVKKMKKSEQNIFDYGKPNQKSYPLNNFCSVSLKSLKTYLLYEQEVTIADEIVKHESNPQSISRKLITHFDIGKEGKDKESWTNYVGLTRAKRNLYLITNPSSEYSSISIALNMHDVYLDYFKTRKDIVLRLRSGDVLQYKDGFLLNNQGVNVAALSASGKEKIKAWTDKGYEVSGAKVSYTIAWKPQDSNMEHAVCLANIALSKLKDSNGQ